MIKLNKKIYDRLVLQAEEAKEFGLDKLADGILTALPPGPKEDEEIIQVSQAQLEKDVYKSLWKVAMNIVAFYDITSVDAENLSDTLEDLSKNVIKNIESSINTRHTFSKIEKPLPGQKSK